MRVKTNKEIILEILEEGNRPNKGEKEDLGIFDIKDTIKEIIEKAKRSIVKKDTHYRLKMKLINNYTWANLSKPAKALLLVIGCFQNKRTGACYLARRKMAKYTGYGDTTIGEALKELVAEGVITKKETWRCNEYFLTTKAKWIEAIDEGHTYFRLFQYQVKAGLWAQLTRSEKAMYPVLYVKGTINYSLDTEDGLDISCIGDIKSVKKLMEWAGISRPTFKTVMDGLEAKSLIEVFPDNTYWLFSLDRLYNIK